MPDGSRLTISVPTDVAPDFEAAIVAGGMTPRRAVVAGQAVDPSAADVVKIIVALGGGATVTALISKLAAVIIEFIRSRRVVVKINGRSFENMNADEIEQILLAEAKSPAARETKKGTR